MRGRPLGWGATRLSSDFITHSLHYYYEEGFLLSWKFGFFFSGRVFFLPFLRLSAAFPNLVPCHERGFFLRIVFEVLFLLCFMGSSSYRG